MFLHVTCTRMKRNVLLLTECCFHFFLAEEKKKLCAAIKFHNPCFHVKRIALLDACLMAVALITMWLRALKPQVFLYTQLFVIYDNNGRVVVTRSVVLCIITGRSEVGRGG